MLLKPPFTTTSSPIGLHIATAVGFPVGDTTVPLPVAGGGSVPFFGGSGGLSFEGSTGLTMLGFVSGDFGVIVGFVSDGFPLNVTRVFGCVPGPPPPFAVDTFGGCGSALAVAKRTVDDGLIGSALAVARRTLDAPDGCLSGAGAADIVAVLRFGHADIETVAWIVCVTTTVLLTRIVDVTRTVEVEVEERAVDVVRAVEVDVEERLLGLF